MKQLKTKEYKNLSFQAGNLFSKMNMRTDSGFLQRKNKPMMNKNKALPPNSRLLKDSNTHKDVDLRRIQTQSNLPMNLNSFSRI